MKVFAINWLGEFSGDSAAHISPSSFGVRAVTRHCRLRMCGDAPDFVEVGEAGIAMDDAMRRQRRVQLVG